MDGKLIHPEMKPAPTNMGLLVVSVLVISSAFLICNSVLVNQRMAAMEGRLKSLQGGEKPNPDTSFDDQKGAKQQNQVLHARDKRSVKQKTQVSTIADFEKRLQALEKRYRFVYM